MQLTIITVNYNSSENTIKLLKSLQEQTDPDFEVIVIDNASEEADFANLKQATTMGTIVIRNNNNLGFSGGNNVGIKKALQGGADPAPSLSVDRHSERERAWGGASWVILLNNDTWVESVFISRLRLILSPSTGSGQVKQGIVGLPLDEGGQVAYCGKIQWLKTTLKHSYQLTSLPAYQLYAIGGAVAIHKDVFEKIGFWDEKYFLYFEDADFSLRARKAEIPITIAPDVMIHHNTSSTTKKLGSSLLLRYHYRNALYFNLKNGPWYIKLLIWPWSWIIVLKQIFKVMIYHNRERSFAILNGVFDFYYNRMGKII